MKAKTKVKTRVYMTAVGTPNERDIKPYSTPAGAKGWLVTKLEDHKEWCDRYNHALGVEVAEVRKTVADFNLKEFPINQHREWAMRDEHTGFTLVVEMWVEEKVDG